MDFLQKTFTPKVLIIIAVVSILIGFVFGKVMGYFVWKDNVISTVEYVSNYDFKEKYIKDMSYNYIKNLIKTAEKQIDFKQYKNAVKTLKEIQDLYPTLEYDKEFQHLMDKL